MKREIFLWFLLVILSISCQKNPSQKYQEDSSEVIQISFYTPDSIKIFGDFYEYDKSGPTILLFHQGGSNARGEYRTIMPQLMARNYNTLAIDQRVGGQIYGNFNRTIANIPSYSFGDDYTYCDALSNLESALDYMVNLGFEGKMILWGSSYSATLAIQLAGMRDEDVDAVLAFSPASGTPMGACQPEKYFENVQIPLLILKPPSEAQSDKAKTQIELARQYGHLVHLPEHGIHGSSMLVEERVGGDVQETWKVVEAFLEGVSDR